jgi:pimeloyl-ACP methyl ester carboxylesterase
VFDSSPTRRAFLIHGIGISTVLLLSSQRRVIAARDSGPIDESGFVRIGGIDQWIAIEGRDRQNPAIVFLHGGPAEAQSPFLDQFVPWTQDFTVCRRLSQRKVILVGQSWGSMLGVHVIRRRPELFHAFVGTGQFVSIASTAPDRLRWTRQQATASSDQETLTALDNLAGVPAEYRVLATADATNKYAMYASDQE